MIGNSPETSFSDVQQGDFALEWAVDRDSLWVWLDEGWLRNVLRHDMISFARDPDPDKDSEPSLHRKRKHGSSTSFFWLPDVTRILYDYIYTSSTAQGGGGSFKNRKPIGEIGCCESGMAERSH